MVVKKNDPRTLADLALAELREDIVSGAITPGSPIRLNKYIEQLQMSAVPIREALRFLEQRGLIDRSPHRGVFVADMSARDLEDTYRVRLELESLAVRAAAAAMTPETAVFIREALEEYRQAIMAGIADASREAHERLHMALYSASNSRWLMLLIPALWDNSERYRRIALPVRGTPEELVAEHARLVEACVSGDPDAAELRLRDHLTNSFKAAVAVLRVLEDQTAKDAEKAREDA